MSVVSVGRITKAVLCVLLWVSAFTQACLRTSLAGLLDVLDVFPNTLTVHGDIT